MILYKYRSLENLEYIADILVHERLFCTPYYQLNDPFEGLFLLTTRFPGTGSLRPSTVTSVTDADYLIEPDDYVDIRVCSLSSSCEDVRLWSLYAGGHRGVAVEIDVEGMEEKFHKVDYRKTLMKHDDPRFVGPGIHQVLSVKTVQWEYESEYRIISLDKYFDIKNRIRRVILGARCRADDEGVLRRLLPDGVDLVKAHLNEELVRIDVPKSQQSPHA